MAIEEQKAKDAAKEAKSKRKEQRTIVNAFAALAKKFGGDEVATSDDSDGD